MRDRRGGPLAPAVVRIPCRRPLGGAIVSALVVGLALLGAAGCWDRTEINDTAMVKGAAFDAGPDGGVTLTVGIVLPTGLPTPGVGTTGGGSGAAIAVVSASGPTAAAAQATLQTRVPGIIFYGQTRVVIIGASLARVGIQPAVDFMLRQRAATPLARFFVTRGEAGDLLKASPPFRPINTDNIFENSLLNIQPRMPAYRVGQELVAAGASFLLPEIELLHTPSPAPGSAGGGGGGGGQKSLTEEPPLYAIDGAGMFRQGRLVGWLSPQGMRGAMWLTGEANRGTVTVTPPGGGAVTLQLESAHIRRTATLRGGRPTIVIDVVARDSVQAVQGPVPPLGHPQTVEDVGRLFSQSIRDRAYFALQQARSLDVDAFGFRRLIAAELPRSWAGMAADWPDGFAEVSVVINVQGLVQNTGNLINTPRPGAAARRP